MDKLTTTEFLQVLELIGIKKSRQGLHYDIKQGYIKPAFEHPKFKLWDIDNIKAYISRYNSDSEDIDNAVKFIIEKR